MDPAAGPRWPTLAQVAAICGISQSQIELRSAEDGWPAAREAFQRKLQEEEDAEHLKQLAAFSVKSRVAFLGTGMLAQQRAHGKLRDDALAPKDLRSVMGAVKDAQQVVEVALGRPATGPTVIVDWTTFARPGPKVVEALPIAPSEDP